MVVLAAFFNHHPVRFDGRKKKPNGISTNLQKKTPPYQVRALSYQRELQAHVTNLVNLSGSKTIEECQKLSAIAMASLNQVNRTAEEMMKLKSEHSRGDRTFSEITKAVSENTERKIKVQEAALLATKPLNDQLLNGIYQIDLFMQDMQEKELPDDEDEHG